MSNELYVIVKFVSGEQVMSILESEDETYIELKSPMIIKSIPVFEERKEHITAHPFCQFSDDTNFIVDKKNVMFIKKLHDLFVPHYKRIVEEHEDMQPIKQNKDGSVSKAEDLKWDDETDEEEQELLRVFIEGNDTIN
jgi:hypothetical protein